MKLAELRQLILKKSQTLQKPKYIVLGTDDYAKLKEELQDLCVFLGVKNGREEMQFNNIQIIADSELLDLRKKGCEHLNTTIISAHSIASLDFNTSSRTIPLAYKKCNDCEVLF